MYAFLGIGQLLQNPLVLALVVFTVVLVIVLSIIGSSSGGGGGGGSSRSTHSYTSRIEKSGSQAKRRMRDTSDTYRRNVRDSLRR